MLLPCLCLAKWFLSLRTNCKIYDGLFLLNIQLGWQRLTFMLIIFSSGIALMFSFMHLKQWTLDLNFAVKFGVFRFLGSKLHQLLIFNFWPNHLLCQLWRINFKLLLFWRFNNLLTNFFLNYRFLLSQFNDDFLIFDILIKTQIYRLLLWLRYLLSLGYSIINKSYFLFWFISLL